MGAFCQGKAHTRAHTRNARATHSHVHNAPAPQQNHTPSQRNRRAVEAVYELRPVPEDHQVPGMKQGGHFDVA